VATIVPPACYFNAYAAQALHRRGLFCWP